MMKSSQIKKELLAKLLRKEGIAAKDQNRVTKQPQKENYPLSDSQRRLWFIEQLQPGNSAYNVPVLLHLKGDLQFDALQKAFRTLIDRHASLRTRFTEIEGEPYQIVENRIGFEIGIEDRRGAKRNEIEKEIKAEAGKGFDLKKAGLLRVRMWQTGEKEYELLMVIHHIITDGWSMGIIVRHLAEYYDSAIRGENAPIFSNDELQYTDYAEWQKNNNAEIEKQLEYWRGKLSGNLETGEMPPDFDRPTETGYAGQRLEIKIRKEIAENLKQIGIQHATTLYMVLTAALKILLWRYSGGEDVSIGTPVANRKRGQTDEIIGFFVNNLLINEKIVKTDSFSRFLTKIRKTFLDAFAHQEIHFEKLVEILQPVRRQGVNPLFQIVFNWHEPVPAKFTLSGLEIEIKDFFSGKTRFDFEFHLSEKSDGEISGFLIYNSEIFEDQSCCRLVENLSGLLETICAKPDMPISKLNFLKNSETDKLLGELAFNPFDYPSDRSLKQLFETRVEQNPGSVCLKLNGQTLSYREVNEKANKVAFYLLENGIEREEFVGISCERSFELVIGILGIIKAGGVYVPLDESYPIARLNEMLDYTEIKTVLTGKNELKLENKIEIVSKPITEILTEIEAAANPQIDVFPENLAYVMFTSGSTGKPKGVSITQRGVVRVAINNFAEFDENEVFLLLAPISFDASTFEMWMSLLNGCQLTIMPHGIPTPETIEKVINENGVSVLWLTSGLFNLIMDRRPTALRGVKHLLSGGDVLSSENVHGFLQMSPDSILTNGYGPTENTTFSCYFEMVSGKFYGKNIPIGFPFFNSEVYILDENLNLLPQGAVGEIYVGGAGLARGYHHQPHLTSENFIPHPFAKNTGERLYKTGDLGRFRNDGSIDFRGRKDKQVKIRGFRIEPAEIETSLMKHPAIRDAAVIADSSDVSNKKLIAFTVCINDEEISPQAIRQFLKSQLPEYMIPAGIAIVEEIPLTENGKVDRRKLLSLIADKEPQEIQLPTDEIETKLAEIWFEVLGGRAFGTDENFFEVGGHSLAAVKVISKTAAHFNQSIPLNEFFDNPTIADLGNIIRQNLNSDNDLTDNIRIPRLKDRTSFRMSDSQRRLWFIEQLQPGNSAYNVPVLLHLKGDLQFDALQKAFRALIDRHASLRTRFTEIEGEPYQIVENRIGFEIGIEDRRGANRNEIEKEIKAEAGKGFDLKKAGFLRVRMWQTGEKEYELLIVIHHIITDGWSMGIIVRHLAEYYRRFIQEKTAEISLDYGAENLLPTYGDYAEWQIAQLEEGRFDEALKFWKDELQGIGEGSSIAYDLSRSVNPTNEGGLKNFDLDEETSENLKRIANEQGATLYMVLAAALKILLWRYSGEQDISIGTPVANRGNEETSGIVGFFVNTLVIRSKIDPENTFNEFLDQVKAKTLSALDAQQIPFEKLVEILHPERDWNGIPFIKVMLILQNFALEKIELPNLEIRPTETYSGKAKLDLVFNLHEENDRICGNIEFSKELYKTESIERLAKQFTNLLKNLSESNLKTIADIELASEEEKTQLLNETGLIDHYGSQNLIHELFENAAGKFSRATALEDGERSWNYEFLNERASRIANTLRSWKIEKSPVAVMLDDSFEAIAAMFGVLKSGNHFFCLDSAHPTERLEQILNETEPKCLITDSESLDKQNTLLEKTVGKPEKILYLNNKGGNLSQEVNKPEIDLEANDPAYIVYTSGSTGKPKGIVQTHNSFSQFISWFGKEFHISPETRLAQWASITYDAAYAEIFGTLAFGGTLCLMNSTAKNDPQSAAQWIFENDVSIFQTVPSFFSKMRQNAGKEMFSNLDFVLLAGENLPVKLAANWLEQFPDSPVLYNLYGPTESVLATFNRIEKIEPQAKSVSVGKAIDGRQILILDSKQKICAQGVPGEIYIRSSYLTKGYFKNPQETAKRFIANPLTGDANDVVFRTGDSGRWLEGFKIEFLGRKDNQIKIRGNRIEVEEIESAFKTLPSISDCAVVTAEDDFKQLQLFAFVVAENEMSAKNLRKMLAEKLPVYMLPSTIVFIEKIPLTASGKPDKIALRTLIPDKNEILRQTYTAPENDLEKELAELWQELLEVEKIGTDDDFFQLGGHSLMAAQIINKIRRKYETEITLRSFLMNPTIRQLAENISISKRFSGIDPIHLAAVLETVKALTDDEVAEMTATLENRS
ncbi:MAG: amino acid adenylation domain-containing protein [Pyrinomonadaceae bacterium]|nr:amino acid adenylation domain-containing protein [Pyrinomonadaceae bacterium]